MKGLYKLLKAYHNNPIISYLNKNFLIEKNRGIISTCKIDTLWTDKIKLDSSFPNSEFKIDAYHFPLFRKDRNSKGGLKIVFVQEDIVAKMLPYCEKFEH